MTNPLGEWTDAELTKARILVMDDDPSVSVAIEVMLAHQGHEAVFVSDSMQGVRALESSKFDLVLIDIFIPGTDGLKTIKELRLRMPAIPIVAMSGFSLRRVKNPVVDFLGMAVQLGARSCLRKPFTPQQLGAAIYAGLNPAFIGWDPVANGPQY